MHPSRMSRGDTDVTTAASAANRGPATTEAGRRLLQVILDDMSPSSERATMLPVLLDPRLRRMQDILEGYLTTTPSMDELERRVGASARTISRRFNESLGMSFTVWRNQLRPHAASLLLAHVSQPGRR